MTKLERLLPVGALLCALIATPVLAQDYDGTIGYGGGGIYFTDFNSGGSGAGFGLDAGWVATAHIEHWINRGRIGGRINGAFTRRPMETAADTRNIHTWIVGGDLLLRLLPPRPERGVAPFISGGVGLVSYGLGSGGNVVLDNALYPGDSDRQFAVSGGLGFDIDPGFTIFGTSSAFRLEIIDHMTLDSPFQPAPPASGSFDPVHNIRVTLELLGLVYLVP